MQGTSESREAVVAARALMSVMAASRHLHSDRLYAEVSASVDALGSALQVLAEIERGRLQLGELFTQADLANALTAARAEAERWFAMGGCVIARGTPAYPPQLPDIADAPPLLFVEGAIDVLERPGIAIVGARTASEEGLRRASKSARILAEAGLVVYSGLAKGIDAAAHRGTLAARGLTVAVMGTPINRRYPSENASLAEAIVAAGGALVTEFFPGERTHGWHFLRRNRTMSGLALATLVIEASETSGAKSQARAALDQGRPVFLPTSLVGAHRWARDMVEKGVQGRHAIEVGSPEDVAEAFAGRAVDDAVVPY